jgi:hypothetical protein
MASKQRRNYTTHGQYPDVLYAKRTPRNNDVPGSAACRSNARIKNHLEFDNTAGFYPY